MRRSVEQAASQKYWVAQRAAAFRRRATDGSKRCYPPPHRVRRYAGPARERPTNIRETDLASGAFEQAHAKFVLQISHTTAHCRSGHFEAPGRFGKAVGLYNLGENHQRIQVRHRDLLRIQIVATECHVAWPRPPERLSQMWKNHLQFSPLFAPAAVGLCSFREEVLNAEGTKS